MISNLFPANLIIMQWYDLIVEIETEGVGELLREISRSGGI
jgi:hypothetical protein